MKVGIHDCRSDRAVTSLACSQTADEVKAERNVFGQKKDEVWRMSDRPEASRKGRQGVSKTPFEHAQVAGRLPWICAGCYSEGKRLPALRVSSGRRCGSDRPGAGRLGCRPRRSRYPGRLRLPRQCGLPVPPSGRTGCGCQWPDDGGAGTRA